MKFGTKAVHAGVEPDPTTGALMTPIYQTSTYLQDAPGKNKGFEYGRGENPTRNALEASLAALENAKHALSFSSGLAAIDAVARMLKPGDEVIASNDLYGGTYRLFNRFYEPLGVKCHFIDMGDVEAVKALINERTRILWIETPTNPLLRMVDIQALCDLKGSYDFVTVVDNTFASPYLQQPMSMGADIVMHSITKYIGGHSDLVMGCLMMDDEELYQTLKFTQFAIGAVTAPMDCFLVLRGIKTLHLRVQRCSENGHEVAHFLNAHPKVEKVYWPGFEDHAGHEIAKKQMRSFGGMLSFTLKGDHMEDALKLMGGTKVFALAESLGGVESLISNPASMTHASLPKSVRESTGLKDSLIRLSVGVEDAEDLIADLSQALDSL